MKMRPFAALALAAVALFTSSSAFAAGTNLVTNGDFSAGLTGWSGGTIWFDNFDPAHDNKLRIEQISAVPPEPATASQTLAATTPNAPLLLSFEYSVDPGHSGVGTLSVLLNGQLVVDPFVMVVKPSWQPITVTATITDSALMNLTNPVLSFTMLNEAGLNTGALIDNVSLTAVPEPALVSFAGFVLLPLARRRR